MVAPNRPSHVVPEASPNGKPYITPETFFARNAVKNLLALLPVAEAQLTVENFGRWLDFITAWRAFNIKNREDGLPVHERRKESAAYWDLTSLDPAYAELVDAYNRTVIPNLLEDLEVAEPPVSTNGHGDQTVLGRPIVVTMSDVEAEPITWLWWPYLAIGKLCMLDGDPGIGKTLLMTQLAASLSRGQPLPDQQGKFTLETDGPQPTLLLSTEDGLADTLKPRLEAAGADCTKIHVLTGWKDLDEHDHYFTLQDLPILEAAVQQYRPRLIVIDPIQAYVGNIDMHRANETRPLMAALTRLAERYGCAIVCIRHPSKPGQGVGKVIHRGLGSIDFIGAARTALFVEQHPTDPGKALMAQSKSNIGPMGRTQVYTKYHGEFQWCGVSRLSAELMAGSGRGPDPHAFLGVVCWLEDHLKPGIPRPVTKIMEALEEDGYHGLTVKRAKKALGIVSLKTPKGWLWRMPLLTTLRPPLSEPLESLSPLEPLESLDTLQRNPEVRESPTQADQPIQEDQEGQEYQEDQVVIGGRVETAGQPPDPHPPEGHPSPPTSTAVDPPGDGAGRKSSKRRPAPWTFPRPNRRQEP
jgi:AAA domain